MKADNKRLEPGIDLARSIPARRTVVAEPVYDCDDCEDRGWRTVGDRTVRECECQARHRAKRLIANAAIPPLFVDRVFADFRVKHPRRAVRLRLQSAVDLSLQYCKRFMEDGEPRSTGLIYTGPPGGGKSHLAATVLQDLMSRYGVRTLFANFTLFMARVRSTYDASDQASTDSVLKAIMEIPVLLFDEIGRERSSEHTMDILHLVIETRYLNKRPTLFTSNYDMTPVDGKASLADKLSAHLVSRIHEMAHTIEMGDTWDYRRDVLAFANAP